MSRTKVCNICGSVFHPDEDNIDIARHVRNKDVVVLTYHTECFEEVAGSAYVPYINTDGLPQFHYQHASSPKNPNNPGIITSKRDLEHYIRSVSSEVFTALNGMKGPLNTEAMEEMFNNDLRQRIPMGVKANVQILPDNYQDYRIVITYEGVEKAQISATVSV